MGLTPEEYLKFRTGEGENGVELTIEDVVEVLGGDREVGSWSALVKISMAEGAYATFRGMRA